MADRLVGYLTIFALGLLAGMSLPTETDHVVIRPTVNEYRVAESFGCAQVAMVCRAKKHSTMIQARNP